MQDIAPSLPEGVQGPAVDDEFDDTFGTIYAFIPEGFTLREVRDSAETIRRELMSLPDMGKTTLLGEQQEQWSSRLFSGAHGRYGAGYSGRCRRPPGAKRRCPGRNDAYRAGEHGDKGQRGAHYRREFARRHAAR